MSIVLFLLCWLILVWLVTWAGRYALRWITGRLAKKDTFGSAHFMTPTEFHASGVITEEPGVVLGRWRQRHWWGGRTTHTLRDSSQGHVLVVGPSRGAGHLRQAGKGTTHVNTSLLEWPFDLCITDPKGELYDRTAAWRASKGSRVYAVDPLGPDCPTHINLLASIRWGTDHAFSDADLLARCFIPDPGPLHPGPQHYSGNAIDILAACFLHVVEAEDDKTMAGTRASMSSAEPIGKRLARMMTSSHKAVRDTAAPLLQMPDKDRLPLWGTAVRALGLWRDPLICQRTQRNDMDLSSFQTGDAPMSLYLRSPEGRADYLGPFMRGCAQTIIARRMEGRPDRRARPVLFMLDEFGSLGVCSPLINALPRAAGYAIRFCFIIQDLSDLTRVYGPHHGVTQNCGTRIFHTPHDPFTARYISMLLGLETVEYLTETTGESGSLSHTSTSASESLLQGARGLMTLDEVLRLDESHLLLFLSAQPPALVEKIPYWDAAYAHRLGGH